MFITKMTVRCDVCQKEEEHESTSSGWGHDAPKGWFSYGRVLTCPDCKKTTTIAKLVELNVELGKKADEERKQRELEEGDE